MQPVSRTLSLAVLGLAPLCAAAQHAPGVPATPGVMVRSMVAHCPPGEEPADRRTAPPAPQVVKGAPYSAVGRSETVMTLADGNRIVREHTTRYYRDGEGRTRVEHVITGVGPFTVAEPHTVVMIHDPVAGQRYVLHPELKQASVIPEGAMIAIGHGTPAGQVTMHSAPGAGNAVIVSGPPMAAAPMPCPPGPPRKPAEPVSLGEKTIDGLRVQGSRTEFQIPAGEMGNELPITISSEQWFSPELGVVVASTHRDPLVGETTFRLEHIVREEPDPSLFAIPADYERREMPPPEHRRIEMRRRP